MATVEAWLAAMPPGDEVTRRIDHLERELALLKVVANAPRYSNDIVAPEPPPQAEVDGDLDISVSAAEMRPLSQERLAIVRVMLETPHRRARPNWVGAQLRRRGVNVDDRNVQTTMQRMRAARQLKRIAKGLYTVEPHVAALVATDDDPPPGRLLEVVSP